MFRTATGDFHISHTDSEASTVLRLGPLSNAFREVSNSCRMDTYVLRRDCLSEANRFRLILTDAHPSLPGSVGQDGT